MNAYVAVGYGITLFGIAAYAWRVVRRKKHLEDRS